MGGIRLTTSVTRRWLLGSALVLAAGLGTLAEAPEAQSAAAGLWRRFGALDARAAQPSTWRESPPPASVAITIDPRPTHAISPLIYGLAHAESATLQATGAQLDRWGGNPNTRYNWLHGSAWNAARDWEFRNYGKAPRGASSAADEFVTTNITNGTQSWLTIPAIGWVARDEDSNNRSVNVPLEGGPPSSENPDGISGYDPSANRRATSLRSVAHAPDTADANVVYQDDWIRHLVSRFGSAESGGVRFYAVDNEPDLWSSTHTDIHPVQLDYAGMLSVFVDYASAIKSVDPTARITGPGLSGWTPMWYSARDRGTDNFASHADRRAHGDQPFLPWWLNQLHDREIQTGQRLLDVLDVHYYPQGSGVFGSLGDEATQRRRLRSTRSLWDPTYTDESWIGEAVNFIPRLRAWRDEFYPGTLLGIGEWNWGADDTLNGALAIANVLGIFGREGLDQACYWTTPPPGSPGEVAFSMFARSFGDQSLPAISSSPDDVAVYASLETATNQTVAIVLNHRPDAAIPVTISPGGGRTEWSLYDATDRSGVRPMGSVQSVTLPPESLSLLRITSAG